MDTVLFGAPGMSDFVDNALKARATSTHATKDQSKHEQHKEHHK
jgi:hypothetical protein